MKQGWTYKKLGELGTIVTGSTPSTKIKEYYCSNDYCFIKPSDLPAEGYQIIVESENYISSKGYEVSRKLPKGSVLVSCIGIIGKTAILGMDACTNQQINAIIPNEYVNNKFLAYSILSQRYVLSSVANAPVVPLINKSDFSKVEIPLPPLSTQLSIVSELDKINELIRLKREQLKDYDNLAQSIFYEMFGDPIENEKGWEVKKLREVCECITDGDHMPPPKSDKGVPFVTIGNINKDTRQIEFDKTFFVPKDYFDNIPYTKKPKQGDILYTVTGSYGIPLLITFDKEFCFQRHIGLLRPNGLINSIYLYMWASNKSVKGQADVVATGIAQRTVSLNSLRGFNIILPPLPLQQLFAQRIELIEKQKAEVQRTISNLETLLASRMQYWFD